MISDYCSITRKPFVPLPVNRRQTSSNCLQRCNNNNIGGDSVQLCRLFFSSRDLWQEKKKKKHQYLLTWDNLRRSGEPALWPGSACRACRRGEKDKRFIQDKRMLFYTRMKKQTKTHLGYPLRQAFCMASMVYRKNSCASSWLPKRKCLAISEGRYRSMTVKLFVKCFSPQTLKQKEIQTPNVFNMLGRFTSTTS